MMRDMNERVEWEKLMQERYESNGDVDIISSTFMPKVDRLLFL